MSIWNFSICITLHVASLKKAHQLPEVKISSESANVKYPTLEAIPLVCLLLTRRVAYWSKCLREPQGTFDLPTYANFDIHSNQYK